MSLILLIAVLILFHKRVLRYLHYFQQEEYDAQRFKNWFLQQCAFDRKGTLICLLGMFLAIMTKQTIFCSFLAGIALILISLSEEDPRKQAKKCLKMTERAARIYRTAFFLAALSSTLLLGCASFLPYFGWVAAIISIQLTPLYLIAANKLLERQELQRQHSYLKEAKKKLAEISPFVIGITGSYGKTSSKDALGNLLQITLGPTFWPVKGVNTEMGITREIRNSLMPGHRYAVIEMGAYGIGSIKKLCALTPPHAALITVVGTAHLERFGSVNNILLAKSELAQAVPWNGILVCNGDNPGARQIAQDYPKKITLLYGFDNANKDLDCWISSWSTTPKGTQFTLNHLGKEYSGFTPLFGQPALSNVIGAFTMACALGSQPEYALAVIRNLEPVNNRLQLEKDGEITYLHDAYNSNPSGFAGALEVAAALPCERRIIMTPGMIELGTQQESENERLAKLAAQKCDLALIVGKTNRSALVKGLEAGGFKKEQILLCDTRTEAFKQLATLRKNGDLILIENDLSDIYESKPKF